MQKSGCSEVRALQEEKLELKKAIFLPPTIVFLSLSTLCFPQHLVIVLLTLFSWNSGFCQAYFFLTLQDHFGLMRHFLLFLQDKFGFPGHLSCLLCLFCRVYRLQMFSSTLFVQLYHKSLYAHFAVHVYI